VLGAWASAVGIAVTVALAVAATVGRALTPLASAVAAAFGIVIVVLVGFGFLLLLVVFVVVSSFATRYRFADKAARHVQEGRRGERGVPNVVAHIVLPTAIALATGLGWISVRAAAVLFACALAFASSDTLASELGVLLGRAVSVLSFRPVLAGTNGGISSVGEAFAVVGSVGTALVGLGLFAVFGDPVGPAAVFLLVVGVAGFVACQVDSVLGATLESRGLVTKGGTNFLGMLSALGIGIGLAALLGASL